MFAVDPCAFALMMQLDFSDGAQHAPIGATFNTFYGWNASLRKCNRQGLKHRNHTNTQPPTSWRGCYSRWERPITVCSRTTGRVSRTQTTPTQPPTPTGGEMEPLPAPPHVRIHMVCTIYIYIYTYPCNINTEISANPDWRVG